MPEGHTIHRLARDHTQWFAGHTLQLSSPQGRFSEGARLLDRCVLREVQAVGKHMLYRFGEGWIHVHLGLFGKFRVHRSATDPRDTVRLRIHAADRWVDLTGPTDCSLWTDVQVEALRARLGPDPLDPRATKEQFATRLARRRRSIGACLLDQAVVAGIGNVYRAELLFLERLDPFRSAADVPPEKVSALWDHMVRLLPIGVKTNRIVTTDPADFGKPASKLTRAERHWVYKRSRCRICDESIEKAPMEGRTVYWCPSCQA